MQRKQELALLDVVETSVESVERELSRDQNSNLLDSKTDSKVDTTSSDDLSSLKNSAVPANVDTWKGESELTRTMTLPLKTPPESGTRSASHEEISEGDTTSENDITSGDSASDNFSNRDDGQNDDREERKEVTLRGGAENGKSVSRGGQAYSNKSGRHHPQQQHLQKRDKFELRKYGSDDKLSSGNAVAKRGQKGSVHPRKSYIELLKRVFAASVCYADALEGSQRLDLKQICCDVSVKPPFDDSKETEEEKVSMCLPGLVVMGAQKGGTTALHSYLMLHPQLIPPRKKELHIFDIDRNFQAWPAQLKTAFIRSAPSKSLLGKLATKSTSSVTPGIAFESTPSYIASTLACERMSTFLSPWTVYVVILRDPVKRLWSEFNMKARRMQNQDMTLRSIVDNVDQLDSCFINKLEEGDDKSAWINACRGDLRRVLKGSSSKISQVIRILSKPDYAPKFYERCLKDVEDMTFEDLRDCARIEGVLREKLPDIREDIINEQKFLQPCMQIAANNKFDESRNTVSTDLWSNADDLCDKRLEEQFCAHCSKNPKPAKCWQSCWDSRFEEISAAASEMGCQRLTRNSTYPPRKIRTNSACAGKLCSCYPAAANMADISKNFLWRGLYYPQVEQCLRYIPRSQIIFLDNDDLRRNPQDALHQITHKLGVSSLPYGETGYTYKDAEEEFNRKYPEFGTTTGWSAEGLSSLPMPGDIELMLRQFYSKPNKLLFKLIGRNFDHWL